MINEELDFLHEVIQENYNKYAAMEAERNKFRSLYCELRMEIAQLIVDEGMIAGNCFELVNNKSKYPMLYSMFGARK